MALFSPLIYAADGRYAVIALPFIAVALGQSFHSLAASERWGRRRVLAPGLLGAMWVLLLIVPFLWREGGTEFGDPNAETTEVLRRLRSLDVRFVDGSYWKVLAIDYFADQSLDAAVVAPYPVRFPESQRHVDAAETDEVVFVFAGFDERPDQLRMAPDQYQREVIGQSVMYIPLALKP